MHSLASMLELTRINGCDMNTGANREQIKNVFGLGMLILIFVNLHTQK
jgi:cyanophycinase-like exopeptidase